MVFFKKIEIFEIQNYNKLFFQFYQSIVFKKIVKVLCCFIVWIRDFIKKFCKTMVFFQKKLRYLKSKISTKFHHLLFLFYFFSAFFSHFVFYFTYPNLSKNYGIFYSVLFQGIEILQTISGKF